MAKIQGADSNRHDIAAPQESSLCSPAKARCSLAASSDQIADAMVMIAGVSIRRIGKK